VPTSTIEVVAVGLLGPVEVRGSVPAGDVLAYLAKRPTTRCLVALGLDLVPGGADTGGADVLVLDLHILDQRFVLFGIVRALVGVPDGDADAVRDLLGATQGPVVVALDGRLDAGRCHVVAG
jgi:hypothetical protein